jgi:hypothetical protein
LQKPINKKSEKNIIALAGLKNSCIFATAFLSKDGPFVYRLGRQVFILVRGVRFPYGLLNYQGLKTARSSIG